MFAFRVEANIFEFWVDTKIFTFRQETQKIPNVASNALNRFFECNEFGYWAIISLLECNILCIISMYEKHMQCTELCIQKVLLSLVKMSRKCFFPQFRSVKKLVTIFSLSKHSLRAVLFYSTVVFFILIMDEICLLTIFSFLVMLIVHFTL